jgi:hypothetical protein
VGAGFRHFAQISVFFVAKLCAKLRLDFFPKLWYNIRARGQGVWILKSQGQVLRAKKNFKNF